MQQSVEVDFKTSSCVKVKKVMMRGKIISLTRADV